MNDLTPSPVSGSHSEPRVLRALRALALLALFCAMAFLLGLAFAAHVLPALTEDGEVMRGPARVIVLFVFILPLLLLWAAYRLRLRSWWWIGGGFLAVAPVFAYLAADDPVIRRPMSVEEIAPAFPGAEQSHELMLRFAKDGAATKAFVEPGVDLQWPKADADHTDFLRQHRAQLDANWDALAPIRDWYDELNGFDRIGDLIEASTSAPIPAWSVHRAMSRHGRARAGLLALEGRGDESIATLLPLMGVGRKMQVHARSLVRAMIGIIVRRDAIRAAEFTLAHAAVSPEMRARLVRELEAGGGGEAGIRRMIAIEYAALVAILPDPRWGGFFHRGSGWQNVFNPFAHLLLNPNRTINLLSELASEVEDLAARRQFDRVDAVAEEFWAGRGRPQFKNLFGTLFIASGYARMGRVTDAFWKLEDHRVALLARLR